MNHTKWPLYFPGLFKWTLQWIYNLQISYSELAIYLGDDNVTNKFKWIKNNPSIVAMCNFTSVEHAILGFCTWQKIENCWSPSNFEVIAVARQIWLQYLWLKQPKETVGRVVPFAKKMLIVDPILKDPPVKVQKDALNPGVFNSQGNQLPPLYNMKVDDYMFTDVKEYIIKTATTSIIGLNNLFGAAQPFQKQPLSFKKWDPLYGELRLLVGNKVNTWHMVVLIFKDQQLKVICFLQEEDWIFSGHSKTIRQICTVLGILNSAAKYFP